MAHLNGWMSIPDPFANAVFAHGGWDSVTLDAQHGLYDDQTLRICLQALAAPLPRRLVRVLQNDAALIGRALDASADGVIVPLVNNGTEARAAASACYYPPAGARSFGPTLAALRVGDRSYMEAASSVTVLPMVETRQALENVADILAVPGITGVFVGPNDLALSLGFAAGSDREEPALLSAFESIVKAAKQAGKMAGIYCTSPAYAKRMLACGFEMVTVLSDTGTLAQTAADCVKAMRA